MRAFVAGHHNIEQLDHDLAVDFRQMVEPQTAGLERANQALAQFLEALHVAADEGAPDAGVRPEKPSDRSADGMAETPRRQVSRRESGGYVSRRRENSDWRWLTRSKPPAASYPQEFRSKSAFRLDAAETLEFGRQQPAPEDQPARQSFPAVVFKCGFGAPRNCDPGHGPQARKAPMRQPADKSLINLPSRPPSLLTANIRDYSCRPRRRDEGAGLFHP
jgi:hypothetical protein